MTKRWVFKIDTPWGKKGSFAPTTMKATNSIHNGREVIELCVNTEDYPDLFELVEEKSDEEKLVDWLSGHYYRAWPPDDNLVAKQLIAAGLDVNKLEVK